MILEPVWKTELQYDFHKALSHWSLFGTLNTYLAEIHALAR